MIVFYSPLSYVDWPLLQKGREKPTFFPIEICNMADRQRVPNKQITAKQQSDIVKSTAISPAQRLNMICKRAQEVAELHNKDPLFMKLGVKISATPMQVPGRVVEAPTVKYVCAV